MGFDLATAKPAESTGFDLSSAKPAMGPRDVPDMPAPGAEPISPVQGPTGWVDAAVAVGSSIPAQVVGRAAAIGHGLVAGKYGTQEGAAEAQAFGSKVANALTYDPRTDAGRDAVDKFSKLIEATKIEGAGPMIPQGGTSSRAVLSTRNVPPKVAAAGKAGLSITPDEAGAGIIARGVAGLSGEAKLSKKIGNKNQSVVVEKISKDLELPKDAVLDRDALEAVREKHGQAYEAVRKAGTVTADDAFLADLEAAVKDVRTAAEDFGHRKESPILKVVESLSAKESFDANSAVSEIKNLRKDAKKAFRAGDEELGIGSLDVARALEGALDRHVEKLAATGEIDPAAMNALRKARVMIAKSYAADKALRGTEINPQTYAKMLEDRVPLTGGAKEVAEFARDFPRSSQKPSHMSISGPDWSDAVMALLRHGSSAGKELLLLGARPIARSALASNLYQRLQRSQLSAGVPVPSPSAGIGLSAGQMMEPRLQEGQQ